MNNGFWSSWQRASCLPDCWCEAPRLDAMVVEPANTWTNISFIIAAIFIFRSVKSTNPTKNYLSEDKRFAYLYGSSLFFLGLGSFFFHASLTFWGQWFDLLGMYFITFYFIIYNFVRTGQMQFKTFAVTYIISVACAGTLIYFVPESRRGLFAISIVVILVVNLLINNRIKAKINHKVLFATLAVFGIGISSWNLDKHKIICDPYALFNGHGVWHFCVGLAAYMVYRYYLTEESKSLV